MKIKQWLWKNLSLRDRILLIMISFIVATTSFIGYFSLNQSKSSLLHLMEQRIEREVALFYEVAQTNMFVFVSNEEAYDSSLKSFVKKQRSEMLQDKLTSHYFIVKNDAANEFIPSGGNKLQFTEELLQQIQETKAGTIHAEISGQTYTLGYRNIQEIQGIFLIAIPQEDYLFPIKKMTTAIMLTVAIVLVIAIVLIALIIKHFISPLANLRELMRESREGKLKVNLDIDGHSPEVNSLIKSYSLLITSLKSMIENISDTCQELQHQGQDLKVSSMGLLKGNEDLVNGITVVKKASEETAASSMSNIHTFQVMKKEIIEIVDEMKEVFVSSKNMNQAAAVGNNKTNEMLTTLSLYRAELSKMNDTIMDIQRHSHDITAVVDIIKVIAEQTKLLSLNATIEAAKAGESGRGFSVVADEVRKLANQSSSAVQEISETIMSMEQLSQMVTKEYSGILNSMQHHFDMATESKNSINLVANHVNSVNEMLQNIQNKMYTLHNLVPNMEKSAESNASHSQESQSYIELMLHQTEEHYEEMKKYHQIGLLLHELSQKLRTHIEKYQI